MLIRRKLSENIFDTFNYALLLMLSIISAYPLLFVLFASLSEPSKLVINTGILWRPIGFTLEGYKLVLKNPNIYTGYMNSSFYVVVGTTINLIFTSVAAYVVSRKNFKFGQIMMKAIIFTMFFNGGLIPNYLVIKQLHLLDNRWALIIPGAIIAWNLIVMKSSFQGIPVALEESARVEGANDIQIFIKIILPISKPVLAVMALFYSVAHWNSWFAASIYLSERSKFPLQIFLREILLMNNTNQMQNGITGTLQTDKSFAELLQYATTIVATLPILFIYPYLQKYFVKGVMVGAIKE